MYATEADLITRWGELHIRTLLGVSDEIDISAPINNVLVQVAAQMDTYLASPHGVSGSALRGWALDLARYAIALEPTDDIRNRHADALSALKRIGQTLTTTPDSGGGESNSGGRVVANPRKWGGLF